jgi:hypothetical protein
MGNSGTKAQTISDTLNQMCNNVITNTINTCSSSVAQNQTQVVNDTNLFGSVNATQSQTTTIDLNCVTSSSMQNTIATNVSNALQQAASASGTGGLSAIGASSSSDQQYLKNIITNNTTTNTSNQLSSNLSQSQNQVINSSGILKFVGATQEQSASVIATAMLNTTGYINAVNTTANAMSQSATAVTTNPIADLINSVGTAVGGVLSSGSGIIIVLVIVAAVVAFLLWRSGFFAKYGFPP